MGAPGVLDEIAHQQRRDVALMAVRQSPLVPSGEVCKVKTFFQLFYICIIDFITVTDVLTSALLYAL